MAQLAHGAARDSRVAEGTDLSAPTGLHVERTGIDFWNVAPDRLRIEIEVANRGPIPSSPTSLRLESAPFGAFVPWRPLTTVRVPALAPGAVTRVGTTVRREPDPAPLLSRAAFAGLLQRGLSTAIGGARERPRGPTGGAGASLGLLALLVAGRDRAIRPISGLAPDLLALVGSEGVHWAGNLNVHLGNRPVERHMARALRIEAGRLNLAMFMLGGGASYSLSFRGGHAEWALGLIDLPRSRWIPYEDEPLALTAGAGASAHSVLVAFRPPELATTGSLEVHVQRRPGGETAVVEFALDVNAQGPGCYTA